MNRNVESVVCLVQRLALINGVDESNFHMANPSRKGTRGRKRKKKLYFVWERVIDS